ncbi:MAG: hypothetical protein WB053_12970 [Nitrososphaeraceae archaeon]|jgi:hypothetical protein
MKNKSRKDETTSLPLSEYEEVMKRLKEALARCLQMLKIGHYKDMSERALRHLENASLDQIKTFGDWILCLSAIADSCLANKHILSQSETYDFLTVAVATNIEEKTRSKAIDDIIFRIYRDIMANYESSNDKIKIAYPNIIVDVVAILAKGINIEGKKIAPFQVELYYQKRKANAGTSSLVPKAVTTTASTSATAASIATIEKRKKEELHVIEADKEKIIESLNKITGRSKKELELSLSKLQMIDIKRLRHLCENYGKLQKYCELIHGSEERFRVELQKDIGRKLSQHQLQRAANSIKQAKVYIENVLDGKFEPHGSYGINHVKHNLEYGYQLTGLIQSKRRSSHKR